MKRLYKHIVLSIMTITRVRLPDYPERPSGGRRDPCAGEPAEYGLWDLYRKDAGRGGIKNGGKCRSLASVSSINNRKAKNFDGLQTFQFDMRRASFQRTSFSLQYVRIHHRQEGLSCYHTYQSMKPTFFEIPLPTRAWD